MSTAPPPRYPSTGPCEADDLDADGGGSGPPRAPGPRDRRALGGVPGHDIAAPTLPGPAKTRGKASA